MNSTAKTTLSAVLALLTISATWPMLSKDPVLPESFDIDKSKFIGAKKCKNCHKSKSQGEIYSVWESKPHAQAFETLQGEKAAEVAKELGIEKAWEAPECLRCHVSGFGLDKKRFKRTFKAKQGVGCESCHGPGELHNKLRLKIANSLEGTEEPEWVSEIPREEILLPTEEICRSCHNEESPTYKEFDFGKHLKEVEHLHPLREKPRVIPPKKDKDGKIIVEEK